MVIICKGVVKNLVGKAEIADYKYFFPHNVFKRLFSKGR